MNACGLQEFVVGILFRITLSINWAYTMSEVLVIATTSAFKVDRHGSETGTSMGKANPFTHLGQPGAPQAKVFGHELLGRWF